MIIANIVFGVALAIASSFGGVGSYALHNENSTEIPSQEIHWKDKAARAAQIYYLPSSITDQPIDSCSVRLDRSKFGYVDFDWLSCLNELREAYTSSVFYNSTMLPRLD